MSGKKHVEDSNQLKLFMAPREIMQRNWSKTEPRPRAVESGQRTEGDRNDLIPVEWVMPEDDHFFREGTHGQFRPGYYHYTSGSGEVVYTSSDEKGYGGTLTVTPASEAPHVGGSGAYPTGRPEVDAYLEPEYRYSHDRDFATWEPEEPVQGELFRQQPGHAGSLYANIESNSRTLSLLGMAARHQEQNYGPATVSSSLTPDSFNLLKHAQKAEEGKKHKSINWRSSEPDEPSHAHGTMRPYGPLHEGSSSDFPSDLLELDDYDLVADEGDTRTEKALANPYTRLREFDPVEVLKGKQYVRDQWTSRKKRRKRITATNRSTREPRLFPASIRNHPGIQTAREYWEANL